MTPTWSQLHIPDYKFLKKFLEWAKAHGWHIFNENGTSWRHVQYINFYINPRTITGKNKDYGEHNNITLAEAVSIVTSAVPAIICKLGDYDVIKTSEGIAVGCLKIPNQRLHELYGALSTSWFLKVSQLYVPDISVLQSLLKLAHAHDWHVEDLTPHKNAKCLTLYAYCNRVTADSTFSFSRIQLADAITHIKQRPDLGKLGDFVVNRWGDGIKVTDLIIPKVAIQEIYHKVFDVPQETK